jgi:hypothetical protein
VFCPYVSGVNLWKLEVSDIKCLVRFILQRVWFVLLNSFGFIARPPGDLQTSRWTRRHSWLTVRELLTT